MYRLDFGDTQSTADPADTRVEPARCSITSRGLHGADRSQLVVEQDNAVVVDVGDGDLSVSTDRQVLRSTELVRVVARTTAVPALGYDAASVEDTNKADSYGVVGTVSVRDQEQFGLGRQTAELDGMPRTERPGTVHIDTAKTLAFMRVLVDAALVAQGDEHVPAVRRHGETPRRRFGLPV